MVLHGAYRFSLHRHPWPVLAYVALPPPPSPAHHAGTAVMAVMMVTTMLAVLVMITCWELSILLVLPFAAVYLAMEGAFLSATLTKARLLVM